MSTPFDDSLGAMVKEVFAGRIPIDPDSRAGFFLRFLVVMFDIQRYYNSEPPATRPKLIESIIQLMEECDDLEIKETEFGAYLRDNLSSLKRAGTRSSLAEQTSWQIEMLSRETVAVPGMLYPDTMRYYKWLARTIEGAGAIVELGCWMGLSTCCLAEGLQENLHAENKRIHVFDSFVWRPWMEVYCEEPLITRAGLKDGDSFIALFWSYCGRFRRLLEVKPKFYGSGDSEWNDGPIILIVFDMADDYLTQECLWRAFLPNFIPGRTVIVFNQFGNARAEGIRRFCDDRSQEIRPIHKPMGSAKGFLYIGN